MQVFLGKTILDQIPGELAPVPAMEVRVEGRREHFVVGYGLDCEKQQVRDQKQLPEPEITRADCALAAVGQWDVETFVPHVTHAHVSIAAMFPPLASLSLGRLGLHGLITG
jgi:hypothetical protein